MSMTMNIASFNSNDSASRQVHPVAKLIQDYCRRFTHCVVCDENLRVPGKECCSSTCYHQFVDAAYFGDEYPQDMRFEKYMK